jgi:hypothetical protein
VRLRFAAQAGHFLGLQQLDGDIVNWGYDGTNIFVPSP